MRVSNDLQRMASHRRIRETCSPAYWVVQEVLQQLPHLQSIRKLVRPEQCLSSLTWTELKACLQLPLQPYTTCIIGYASTAWTGA